MKTQQKVIPGSANSMTAIADNSVQLTVTSPPYPMIQMWDDVFARQNKEIENALLDGDGDRAFELMHNELDSIWQEVYRVTAPGGMICINIGDATRTIDSNFKLYSNHSRILSYCLGLGLGNLPNILWRKQTNAPNKFMGSGMLPPGAYVTLEHEYILVFRKGRKREFQSEEMKRKRMQSAFFWEERNVWFSDIWDLKGTSQQLLNANGRDRSAAFPFELAYRLINMFSIKGDLVLDPFLGTGTTLMAAAGSCRNGIGYEIDQNLIESVVSSLTEDFIDPANNRIRRRLADHQDFVRSQNKKKGATAFKYKNSNYDFAVMTKQETNILFNYLQGIARRESTFEVGYFVDPVLYPYQRDSLFFSVG